MRIALVSPYSWTYQGGVNRHVEALAEEFIARGHEVRVLAPWDPPDRLNGLLHRGQASDRKRPDYLVSLGRTIGYGANGAVSNLSSFPEGPTSLRRELRAGNFDIVHVHEPPAPLIGWDACSFRGAPVVGTFHAYSTKPFPNHMASLLGARRKFNQLSGRIAVSQAAAWTAKRWYGGEYAIVPNGVDIEAAPKGPKSPSANGEFRVAFLGRAEERKGLPILLHAFEALVEHVPARLTVIGADADEVARFMPDPALGTHVDTVGKISDAQLWRELGKADVLSAPSLSGESFGMVLIEAFAAGTPVVASQIAGYSDVVSDGVDGVLVPPADAQRLAEELQSLYHEPERLRAMGEAGRKKAERFAWPRVADQVERVYDRAINVPEPVGGAERAARTIGLVRADGGPRRPARKLPSLDPIPEGRGAVRTRWARRLGFAVAFLIAAGLTLLAAEKIGVDKVVDSVVRSDATWVAVAVALMCTSLFFRAVSWFAIARAALPRRPIRRRDVTSATMIGVLMSATLPARFGEPARAMVLARRIGRMRETFPVLLGTLVTQTVLNIVALVGLGVIIVSTTDLFHQSTQNLFYFSFVPLLLLIAVIALPFVLRASGEGRIARIGRTVRGALLQVRQGLAVFKKPKLGAIAASAQLGAWVLQTAACWALLSALGLQSQAGIGAAAAVLFAVNVTAVVPATPSNIGIFQLAVVSVLHTGFDVSRADALAYGIILQAVEIATAVGLGVPALVREGVTWSDMRMRALSAAPVRLEPRTESNRAGAGARGPAA
jgi:phosphatidyl-myo-inositol alpha-mannosyltransferase